MSGKFTLNLEILDSSLSGDVRDKLIKVISPAFEMQKSKLTEEYYLAVNQDFRHLLKQSNNNILDFAIKEFGWKDIYDVDLLAATISKKYDNTIKTSLKDAIDVDNNDFYQHHIVIKLSHVAFCFFSIVGKKLKDALGMEEKIEKKTSELEKVIDEKEKAATENNNKKYDKLRFELDNVAVTSQKLKDQVTKDISDILSQVATIKTSYFDEINKLREHLNGLNTSIVDSKNEVKTELKADYESKTSALNDKFTEFITNVSNAQNDQHKSIESIKAQSEQKFGALQHTVDEQVNVQTQFKAETDAKFAELKTVNDTKFHTFKTEGDAKYAELKALQEAKYQEQKNEQNALKEENKTNFSLVTTENNARYNELSNKINDILKTISGQATEMKGYMNILESNVNDIESKVFPNGKEIIRH